MSETFPTKCAACGVVTSTGCGHKLCPHSEHYHDLLARSANENGEERTREEAGR